MIYLKIYLRLSNCKLDSRKNLGERDSDSVLPITRTALGVSNGDDLDHVEQLPIDHGKRVAIENAALGSVQVGRIELRALTDCEGTLRAGPLRS